MKRFLASLGIVAFLANVAFAGNAVNNPPRAAGGGGITTITSTGGTLTVTAPGGPTTNLDVAVAGGGITQLTGDVTAGPGSGSQASTISAGAVTLADMANMATASFIGRITAGSGVPQILSAANAWTNLGVMPAANFPALTGDVTTSAGALATTIANNAITSAKIAANAVTLAKLATQADQTVLGNGSGGAAVPVALTFTGLTATATVLQNNFSIGVSGGQTAYGGSATTENLTLRPNAADATTGAVIAKGLQFEAPFGTINNPGYAFDASTGQGFRRFNSNIVAYSAGGVDAVYIGAGVSTGVQVNSNSVNIGFTIGTAGTAGLVADGATGLALMLGNTIRYNIIATTAHSRWLNTPFVSFTSSSTARAQAGGEVMAFGATPPTLASGASITLDAYKWDAATVTLTGTTTVATAAGFNLVDIEAPTYTDASAVTVTNAATMTIKGAPIAAGSVTITNAYALWLQGGGSLRMETGSIFGPSAFVRPGGGGAGQLQMQAGDSTNNGIAYMIGADTSNNQQAVAADGRNARVFVTTPNGGNFLVGATAGAASSVYGAQNVMILEQAATAPTSAPAKDHAVIWVDGGTGSLKCRTNTSTYTLAL